MDRGHAFTLVCIQQGKEQVDKIMNKWPLRGHGFDMGMIFATPPLQAALHGFAHPAKYDFRVGP